MEVKKEYIEEVLAILGNHKKKHNKRKITLKKLDKLCGL